MGLQNGGSGAAGDSGVTSARHPKSQVAFVISCFADPYVSSQKRPVPIIITSLICRRQHLLALCLQHPAGERSEFCVPLKPALCCTL